MFFLKIIPSVLLAGAIASVPHLPFMQELMDRGDAISAAAEAQTRINVKFTELLISGMSCERAADEASDLAVTCDSMASGGAVFKGYVFSPRYIEPEGTVLSFRKVEPDKRGNLRSFDNLAVIQAPRCGVESLLDNGQMQAWRSRLDAWQPSGFSQALANADGAALLEWSKNCVAGGVAKVKQQIETILEKLGMRKTEV